MQLHGLHHVTAVTAKVQANVRFYTELLGLRLVKKSVNQDDVSAYHLFYADKIGSPGTDMTFFDWAQIPANRRGTDSIVNTQFRVNGRAALDFWVKRFDEHQVKHHGIETFAGHEVLRFEDGEGQRLTLVDDQGAPFEGEVWERPDIPADYALLGFYAVTLSFPQVAMLEPLFQQVLGFEKVGQEGMVSIFAMDGGGAGKEVHVIEEPQGRPAQLGYGGVHHVAFRLKDDGEQRDWLQQLRRFNIGNSGVVDRFYFKSLYFRISNGILFELATDEPGFDADEPLETLGERLALPPFLEPHRDEIEAGLKPL